MSLVPGFQHCKSQCLTLTLKPSLAKNWTEVHVMAARREEHDALLLMAQQCEFLVCRETLTRHPDLQGLEKPMAKICLPELGDLDGKNLYVM